MSKALAYTAVVVTLTLCGCTSNINKSYNTDESRAMPEQTYWWEEK